MNDISKWIWADAEVTDDCYGEFCDSFDYDGGNVCLSVSADSNYAVYINGRFVDSGQYPDFPYYKVYDKIDITEHCKKGKNAVGFIVWYYGKSNMGYYPGNAALRFEVACDDDLLAVSDENTLSRISKTYKNNYCKVITGQLGFGFYYDITKERDTSGFEKSIIVDQSLEMFPRPNEKNIIGELKKAAFVKSEDDYVLYDIGYEEVGYFEFKVNSPVRQKLTVSYGEHIADGRVRRIIGSRDFSFEIVVGEGQNEYFNPFRRLGLRYLEITCETPVEVEYIGVRPVYYPLEKTERDFGSELRNSIYKTSVRTLELCMHDHYEDCPWREQALYAMDSRNQMLCGYYAFNEFKFPRSNLLLMSKDNREDRLLSICTPSAEDLTIPSFSLHYITEVYEYTVYSKDTTLAEEIYPKLKSVLSAFTDRLEDNCVRNFKENGADEFAKRRNWNFYEWADGLDGRKYDTDTVEAALNFLLIIALRYMHKISAIIGKNEDFEILANKITVKSNELFFDEKNGLYVNSLMDDRKSELVNSLAILCGAAAGERAMSVAEKIASGEGIDTPATLSMMCFKYDALLSVDSEYKQLVLADIDSKYQKMLDAGATSFWETELGESDFHNAGSLCHGWSAMPVYYYSILLQ